MNYKGLKKIMGIETHDLEVIIKVMDSEYHANYYFDINSHLLVAQRKVMPIHARGDDVDILVGLSDYKSVDGVLYPFTHIERNEKTGEFLNATIWNGILANKDIPMHTFNPPNEPD